MSRQLLTIYGTEFDELDQEQAKLGAPKKPTAIQDQVAKDEQGRRRFHGAFTGGFSAGYFMTAGSKEGWIPSEFRSSRDERGTMNQMRPEDLMDKEDLGEYGIGARKIRQTDSFNRTGDAQKRRMAWEHDASTTSSIAHALEGIVRPASSSIGVQMLRAMGWKEGRGVGLATVTQNKTRGGSSAEADFDRQQAAKVAPGYDLSLEDELVVQLTPCSGTQGLGYTGLQQTNVLDEKWGQLEAVLKAESLKKKGRGIRGQAFGVGAFEEEDESVYTQFDMAQYDFALDGSGGSQEPKAMTVDFSFEEMPKRLKPRTFYNAPRLPSHWKPNHKAVPIDAMKLPETIQKAMKLLTVEQRARLLGEDRLAQAQESKKSGGKTKEGVRRSRWDIRAEQIEQEQRSDPNRVEFPEEPMKQRRFKEFLTYVRRGLPYPKPTDLSVWEWESERKDFEAKLTIEERGMLPEVQSRSEPLARSNLALPIKELMNNKFTKETGSSGQIGRKDEDKLAAVKMGMFGERTRSMFDWYPDSLLARRFNVPNPHPGATFSGCPHLQKSTKTETLVNLGLPNTAAEIVMKRQEAERRPQQNFENEGMEEDEEDEVPEVVVEKPPTSIFDAIFGDFEGSDESSSEDEERKKPIQVESSSASDSDDEGGDKKEEKAKDSAPGPSKPTEKVITVMDLFKDEEYGPAAPPQVDLENSGLSAFSVLRYLKKEQKERKKKKHSKEKSHGSRKHEKERKHHKKSKSEKKPKKEKKEKKKSKKEKKHRHRESTPELSSDSSDSSDSDIQIVD